MDKNNRKVKDNIEQNAIQKSKIFVFSVKIEFETLIQFLNNFGLMRPFLVHEMYNILIFSPFFDYLKKVDERKKHLDYFIIVPDKSNKNECSYKVEVIFIDRFINYLKIILRLSFPNEKNINKFWDINVSIYMDNVDNSTFFIYEAKSDLSSEIFNNFFEITKLFYQRLEKYLKKKISNLLCYETIIIEKNMIKVYNYISLCKIFIHNKVKLEKVCKLKEKINLTFEIPSDNPTKKETFEITIINISKINCLVVVNILIDSKTILDEEYFLKRKSFLNHFLKILRQKIADEKEG